MQRLLLGQVGKETISRIKIRLQLMQSISRNARPMLLITYKKFILSLNRLEILSGE